MNRETRSQACFLRLSLQFRVLLWMIMLPKSVDLSLEFIYFYICAGYHVILSYIRRAMS